MTRTARLTGVALVILATLTGCAQAGPGEPTTEPTPSSTTTESASPSPTPTSTFTMPTDCTAILPASQFSTFAADGIILLAGPGGKYGDELITQPTPEMQAGGISCYFGTDNDDPNLLKIHVLLSVVPLTAANQQGIIDGLEKQGLLKGTDTAGHLTYGIAGGTNGMTTAAYSIVADASWISAVSATGGKDSLNELMQLTSEMHDVLYQ